MRRRWSASVPQRRRATAGNSSCPVACWRPISPSQNAAFTRPATWPGPNSKASEVWCDRRSAQIAELESRSLQCESKTHRGELVDVNGGLERRPLGAHVVCDRAARIGHLDGEYAARAKRFCQAAQLLHGSRQVLEYVPERDCVIVASAEVDFLDTTLSDIDTELFAGRASKARDRLDSRGVDPLAAASATNAPPAAPTSRRRPLITHGSMYRRRTRASRRRSGSCSRYCVPRMSS
jgi:hypothetical protein